MADFTVLVSPTLPRPRPQSALGFNLNFARRSQPELVSPVMVTLETADPSSAPSSPVEVRTFDEALLSPPKRTSRGHRTQSSVSMKRPQSAPPTKVSFSEPVKPPPRRVFSTFPSTFPHTRELKRPPPPLCEFSHLVCLFSRTSPYRSSPPNDFLAQNKAFRRHRRILFTRFPSRATRYFPCCRPFPRHTCR
jgi:hypothetical protein